MIEQLEGQESLFDRDGWFGKMSSAFSHREPQREQISKRCLPKSSASSSRKAPMFLCLKDGLWLDASQGMGGPLPGEYTTRSFGESPKEGVESRLSQILEDSALPKYYLSAKACRGILNRAEKRGKELPEILKTALVEQAKPSAFKNEPENLGGGKGILIQNERTGAISTLQNQRVLRHG